MRRPFENDDKEAMRRAGGRPRCEFSIRVQQCLGATPRCDARFQKPVYNNFLSSQLTELSHKDC